MAGLLARGLAPLTLPSRTAGVQWPARVGQTGQRLPLTVAGTAADLPPDHSVQPELTAFPFHPLARDHRPEEISFPPMIPQACLARAISQHQRASRPARQDQARPNNGVYTNLRAWNVFVGYIKKITPGARLGPCP